MSYKLFTAASRGHLNHGWLDTYHTFTFGEYINRDRINFGAMRVLNDDFIAPQGKFQPHPHNNMEIISVVLEGAIEHEDSLGNKQTTQKGEIQVMSAGKGIVHSEANPSMTEILNLFQIWIYPKKHDIMPRYEQKSFLDALKVTNQWHTLVGPNDENGTLLINQDAFISMAEILPQVENCKSNYQIKKAGNGVFIMVIDGEIEIDNVKLKQRDAIAIENINTIEIRVNSLTKLIAIEVPLNFTGN